MKLLYEFIPRLDFVNAADKVKDLVDGWNITDHCCPNWTGPTPDL